jgi:hypothetical protein
MRINFHALLLIEREEGSSQLSKCGISNKNHAFKIPQKSQSTAAVKLSSHFDDIPTNFEVLPFLN